MNELEKAYPLIPMNEIHEEARKIAVVWVENYEPNGFDLPNKHKLASDIQNFAINWQKERSYSEEDLKNAFNAGGMAANNKFLTWDDWFNQNKKK